MTPNPTPPSDVDVEPATTEDAETMASLWVDLASDQRRHGSHLEPEANRNRIHEVMLKAVVTDSAFVARRDGDVVGFVTFGQERERFEQDVTRGVVHNVYVRPGDRGEDIGSALLAAAETALFERGVDAVSLEAMAANDAARRFYRRHGYRPHRVEMEKRSESDNLTTDG